jgi:hypothetical protein
MDADDCAEAMHNLPSSHTCSRVCMDMKPQPLLAPTRRSRNRLISATTPKRLKKVVSSCSPKCGGAQLKKSWRLFLGPAPACTYWWLFASRTCKCQNWQSLSDCHSLYIPRLFIIGHTVIPLKRQQSRENQHCLTQVEHDANEMSCKTRHKIESNPHLMCLQAGSPTSSSDCAPGS